MYGTKKLAIKKFSLLQKWTNFWKFPRQVADVNGDGRTDIVGFGCDAVYVSFFKINGNFFQAFKAITYNFTVKKV